jgi:radical SAM-linked protein
VTKLGPAAYLGHLDLMRLVPRIFRRAGVPLSYGGGFHPKPAIAASPALGLGTASAGEVFDVRLLASAADLAVPEILSRLDAAAPAGIRFLAARALDDRDPALGRVIQAADFAIEAGALGDAAAAASRVAALAGRDVTIVRAHKGHEKRLSVGAFVLAACPPGPEVDPEALGLRPPVIVVRLRLAPDGSLRPHEVIEAALGAVPAPRPRAARLSLWGLRPDGSVADPLTWEP